MPLKRTDAIRNSTKRKYGAIPDPQPANTDRGTNSGNERLQSSNNGIGKLQDEVHEVKDILRDNIEKVIERGDKVGDLQDRTETLADTSSKFRSNATTVRKQTQRRNWKLCCCILCIVFVVLAAATVIVLFALKII